MISNVLKCGLLVALLLGEGVAVLGQDLPVIRSRRLDEPEKKPAEAAQPALVRPKTIRLGLEYAMIDSRRGMEKLATVFGEAGATFVKPFPGHHTWGAMQKSKKAKINFDRLDEFILAYQAEGIRDFMICLRSDSKWASKEFDEPFSPNPTPKPEFQEAYQKWVSAVVERYDGDGVKDVEGLRSPVRLYAIGAEFSIGEPEPAEEYVEMLRLAYAAAHQADPSVQIAHAGIVTTLAFAGDPEPEEYEEAFELAGMLLHHKLPAIRTLLDAQNSFDVLNLHAFERPTEIPDMMAWLKHEMASRGGLKPVIIGSSALSPFITGGVATDCTGSPIQAGVLIPPAAEADRCRLARYFTDLVDGDEYTQFWVNRFSASELVKKAVIAAAEDVALINLGLMEDVKWQQKRKFRAATGNVAWSGMVDLRKGRRPALFALNQVSQRLRDYDSIRRVPADDDALHIYQVVRGEDVDWVAWMEPASLLLPGDATPKIEIDLPTPMSTVIIERMISKDGQVHPTRKSVIPVQGLVPVVVTPYPVYIYSRF